MTISIVLLVACVALLWRCSAVADSTEYNVNVQDVTRGPSNSIWAQVQNPTVIAQIQQTPNMGMEFFDDFTSAGLSIASNVGIIWGNRPWQAYMGTNGVLGTDPNLEGGVILLSDGGNSTVDMEMTQAAGWAGFISPATGNAYKQQIYFEARVAVGSITTAKRDAFIGLASVATPPTANMIINSTTNTLSTTPGLFGFHFRSTTNPTDVGVAYNVAGGTVQYPANLQTLSNTVAGAALTAYSATNGVATGFIKLGFIFDPTSANPPALVTSATGSGQTVGQVKKPVIQFFVNGQVAPAFFDSSMVQSALFPSNFLAPVIAYESRSGTSAGGLYVDWVRCISIANS
jgi:hypothetical protein